MSSGNDGSSVIRLGDGQGGVGVSRVMFVGVSELFLRKRCYAPLASNTITVITSTVALAYRGIPA